MPQSTAEQKVIIELSELCSRDEEGHWRDNFYEILKKVSLLESLQPRFSLVDKDRPWALKTTRLRRWLSSDPAFSSLEDGLELVDDLSPDKGQRGVRTKSKVTKGDTLMRVPLSCMLSTETAFESRELGPLLDQPLFSFLFQVPLITFGLHLLIEHSKCLEAEAEEVANSLANPKTGDDESMFLEIPRSATILDGRSAEEVAKHKAHLHIEKGKLSRPHLLPVQPTTLDAKFHPWGSRFRAFIACLPESTSMIKNCPSWQIADYELLGNSLIAQNAARCTRDLIRAYIKVYPLFTEQGSISGLERHFTWAHWKWVFCVILSRKNLMPGRSRTLHQTLCPLYDMVNHEPGDITAFFSHEHGGIELNAKRDFEKGEEILMSYGKRSVTELTMYQGFFVESDSLVDTATVQISIKSIAQDPLALLRVKMLQNLKICSIMPGESIRIQCSRVIKETEEEEKEKGEEKRKDILNDTTSSNLRFPSIFCTFCRIAALDKPSLILALRLVQSVISSCGESNCTEPTGKHSHGQEQHSHSHNHSHGGTACDHSHGSSEDLKPLVLPFVNDDNENAALELAKTWLTQALDNIVPEPELHGLAATPQTKVLVSYLQGQQELLKEALLDVKGLWKRSLSN
jgi:hypothetical protein